MSIAPTYMDTTNLFLSRLAMAETTEEIQPALDGMEETAQEIPAAKTILGLGTKLMFGMMGAKLLNDKWEKEKKEREKRDRDLFQWQESIREESQDDFDYDHDDDWLDTD